MMKFVLPLTGLILASAIAPPSAATSNFAAHRAETADPRVCAIVDYAHNKLSYQRFFSSLSKEFAGRALATSKRSVPLVKLVVPHVLPETPIVVRPPESA